MLRTLLYKPKLLKRLYISLVYAAFSPALQALPAHIHGKALMQVAIEGNEIHLDFDSPLDNLLGFEHSPKDDRQRQSVTAMAARFQHAESLFVTNKAAACQLKTVNLSSPVLSPALLGSTTKPAPQNAVKTGQEDLSHAGLTVEILLTCANPAALNAIDVQLFKAFPLLQQLQVELITLQTQSVTELQADNPVLTW